MKPRELVRQVHAPDQIRAALTWAGEMIKAALPGGTVVIKLGRPRRSLDQNAKMWPMLTDIAKQVRWSFRDPSGALHENVLLAPEQWKDIFSASLEKQLMAPGVDGDIWVYVAARTSRMNTAEFSQLIELIYAFGADHNVRWSEPAKAARSAA